MEATLNVRMGATLKERGDKVLKEHGISTSAAVRALWQELARTRELPAFLAEQAEQLEAKRAKLAALESLSGVAKGTLSELSDEELNSIGMQRYE